MSQSLLTILHISDLHIGAIDAGSGNAQIPPMSRRLVSNFSLFDGLLGHSSIALQDLCEFYERLEKPLLLVSGDLTRSGATEEFETAASFLGGLVDLNPPNQSLVGLSCAGWQDPAIPGNHDQWGGGSMFGGPSAAFPSFSPSGSLPFVKSIALGDQQELQLIKIDTDADVGSFGLRRLLAMGSFQSQLEALTAQLSRRQENQIRVLVMHHSWSPKQGALSIDQDSRQALARFLVDYGIQIILSGHLHDPLAQAFFPDVSGPNSVLECRCGTTTMIDALPYGLPTMPWRQQPRLPNNSLFVHHLFKEDQSTFWRVSTYTRRREGGFDEDESFPDITLRVA